MQTVKIIVKDLGYSKVSTDFCEIQLLLLHVRFFGTDSLRIISFKLTSVRDSSEKQQTAKHMLNLVSETSIERSSHLHAITTSSEASFNYVQH